MSDASDDVQLQEALAFIEDLTFEFDLTEAVENDLASVSWNEVVSDEAPWASLQQLTDQRSLRATDSIATYKWPAVFGPRLRTLNPARTRRREELLHLRGVARDLEHRLVSLQADQTKRASTSRPEAEVEETREETKEFVAAWEQIAARQYKQRQESEMENVRLRRLLEDQIQLGKSIERILLKKRPSIESLESSAANPKPLRPLDAYSMSHMEIIEELLVRCALQYAETDGVVARLNRRSLPMSFRDVCLVPCPSLGLTLQSTDIRILPFSYGDTVDELWRITPAGSTVVCIHEFQDVDHTEDTITFQLHVTLVVNHEHNEFNVKVAVRRYVEANRTVIVFAGMIESSETTDRDMDGVRMQFKAWHIIEPVDRRGLSHSTATKVTSHFVFTPDVEEGLRDRVGKVGRFTDLLLSSLGVDFEHRKQHLENRLLQRALAAA